MENNYIDRDDMWSGRMRRQVSYDHCMYALDVRSIDLCMQDREPHHLYDWEKHIPESEENVLDKYKRFVASMYYYFGSYNKKSDWLGDELNYTNKRTRYVLENLEAILRNFTNFIEELILAMQEVPQLQESYQTLIKWPLKRLTNLRDGKTASSTKRKMMYCNMAALRTSQFLAFNIDSRDERLKFMDEIIGKMWKLSRLEENDENFSEMIREYTNKRCVAIASAKRMNGTEEWYMALSGFWDNDNIRNRFCMKAGCERKILACIWNKSTIKNIHFYITFEPCSDCRKALQQLENKYRKGMIFITARKSYRSRGHVCNIVMP